MTLPNRTFALLLVLVIGSACSESSPQSVAPPTGQTPPLGTGGDPDASGPADDTAPPEDDAAPTADQGEPPVTGPGVLTFQAATGSTGAACKHTSTPDASTTCAFVQPPEVPMALAVLFQDASGRPIEGGSIQFATEAPAHVAKLSGAVVYTGADGRAQVTLQTFPDSTGTIVVTAAVMDDPRVPTLRFEVLMATGSKPPLVVTLTYGGLKPLNVFDARLFLQEGGKPTCADIHPDTPGLKPQPVMSVGPWTLAQAWTVATLPGLDTAPGGQQTWLVQVLGPSGQPTVAHGCAAATVTKGQTTQTTLTISDLPLTFTGKYLVETTMDAHTGLPGTAGGIVSTLVDLFDTPGETAILTACANASGTLDIVCGFLVDSCNAGEPGCKKGLKLGATGIVAASAADSYFNTLIAENLGTGILFTGDSLVSILKHLTFRSTIDLQAEPSQPVQGKGAAFPQGSATDTWEYMLFVWKFGKECPPDDDQCGLEIVKLSDIFGQTPFSPMGGGVTPDEKLWLDAHPVPGLSFGTLIDFLVEKKLLPLIFGTVQGGFLVDTYDELVHILFGDSLCLDYDDCCEYFATKIQDSVPSYVVPFIPAACELAIDAIVSYVKSTMVGIGGQLTVATPLGAPCPAADKNGDRSVDALGSKPGPCTWDAQFSFQGGPWSPASTWFGARK